MSHAPRPGSLLFTPRGGVGAGRAAMNISIAIPGLSLHASDPLARSLGGRAHPPCGPVRLLRTGQKCKVCLFLDVFLSEIGLAD